MNINWYPGHMAKAMRELEAELSGIDAVVQLLDARIPNSSRNPELEKMCKQKPVLTVLGRADLADPEATASWKKVMPGCISVNASSGAAAQTVQKALEVLLAPRMAADAARGRPGRAPRVLVSGIPNVGKSTLINTLLRRKAARAEDRPGVTRQKQWFPMGPFMLMDTPGLLWPKIDNPETGFSLAFTGSIRDEILDTETLAAAFTDRLNALYPDALAARYGISGNLESIAKKRGYLLPGGIANIERMSLTLLDDFRSGKLGRITLELPP